MCDREINRGWKVVEGMLYASDSQTEHRCAVHAVGAGGSRAEGDGGHRLRTRGSAEGGMMHANRRARAAAGRRRGAAVCRTNTLTARDVFALRGLSNTYAISCIYHMYRSALHEYTVL
jgi:hypothetical protein